MLPRPLLRPLALASTRAHLSTAEEAARQAELRRRRREDLEARRDQMTELLREQALREAEDGAAATRPGGILHVLSAPPAEAARTPPQRDGHPERGGPTGLEPTRFGDWERRGRASDF
ncbi:hypothetical protein AB1Y20_012762 [Prymnesium parvum]|uniref:Succinate dehydrogenase assembly factor 4, mitochondrial n=1 Tax=Prymnesium parvum TaxID=97485 RepID=A0AB34IJK0_PRYPA